MTGDILLKSKVSVSKIITIYGVRFSSVPRPAGSKWLYSQLNCRKLQQLPSIYLANKLTIILLIISLFCDLIQQCHSMRITAAADKIIMCSFDSNKLMSQRWWVKYDHGNLVSNFQDILLWMKMLNKQREKNHISFQGTYSQWGINNKQLIDTRFVMATILL